MLNGGPAAVVQYAYNELGQLVGKSYGGQSPVARDTLRYNIQGWLTEQTNDKFGMKLRYYDPVNGASPSFTGNISEWEWQHKGSPGGARPVSTYAFSYDKLSRLTEAVYSGPENAAQFNETFSYDLNGNIGGFEYVGNRIAANSYDSNENMTQTAAQGLQIGYNV